MPTRTATVTDAAKIWSLYRDTGFLYPGKLQALGAEEAKAQDTLRRLLSIDSEIYRITIVEDDAGELRSVCTSAQFSDTQFWVMHLASRHDRYALVDAIVRAGNSAITSQASYLTYTYRQNNRSVRRLFESHANLGVPAIEQSTYAYYSIDDDTLERTLDRPRRQDGVAVRPAKEHDLAVALAALKNDSNRYTALAGNGPLDGYGIASVASQLASAQLIRERQAFTATVDGKIAGIALCDLSPCGWNLSGLGTGVQMFMVEKNATAVVLLLSAARGWFRSRHATPWVLLVNQSEMMTSTACESLGLAPSRIYCRITLPITLVASFIEGYTMRITRGAPTPAVAVHERVVCI